MDQENLICRSKPGDGLEGKDVFRLVVIGMTLGRPLHLCELYNPPGIVKMLDRIYMPAGQRTGQHYLINIKYSHSWFWGINVIVTA